MAKWESAPLVEGPKLSEKWKDAPLVEGPELESEMAPTTEPENSMIQQIVERASQVLPEAARVAGTGVTQGVMALPNLAETIVGAIPGEQPQTLPFFQNDIQQQAEAQGMVPLQQRLAQAMEAMQPQTPTGQTASDVIGAGVGAITGAGGIGAGAKAAPQSYQQLVDLLKIGLGSGVGAEAAEMIAPESTAAQLAGSVIGGGVAAGGQGLLRAIGERARMQGKRRELADILTQGIDEASARQAADLQRTALAEQGVQLSAGQVLPKSNIPAFENFVTSYPQGQNLAQLFRQQPEQVAAAAQRTSQGIPGAVVPPQALASQTQSAATDAIKAAKNWRSDLVRPGYKGQIPLEDSVKIQQVLNQRLKEATPGQDKAELIQALKNNLTERVGTEITPMIGVQKISEALRGTLSQAANPSLGAKPYSQEARNALAQAVKDVKKIVGEAKPKFAAAEKTYASASRRVVNPLKESVVGKTAGVTGYLPGKASSQKAISDMFEKGTPGKGKSAILTTQRDLARWGGDEGKAAFNDSFKTWFSTKLSKALETEGGTASPKIAKNINDAFFKSEAQRQGFRDAITGVARNSGNDPDQMVKGMETFIRTISAASKAPANIGLSGTAVSDTATTMLGKLNAITAFTPVRMPARFINEYLKRDALRYVSGLLDTPEGIETLMKLSKVKPGSREAYGLIGTSIAATVELSQSQQEE